MARSSAPPSKPRRGSSRPACSRRWWSSRPPWEREALEAARAGHLHRREEASAACRNTARPPRRAPIRPAGQSNRRRREGAGRERGAGGVKKRKKTDVWVPPAGSFFIKHTCIRLVGKQTAQVHMHTQACSGRILKDRYPPTLHKSPYDIREIQTRLRGALCLPPTASAMDPRSCS